MPALLAFCLAATALAGCRDEQKAEAPAPRPVKTITAVLQDAGETVVLTGNIQAQDEASIAFRIGGRMTKRLATSATGWSPTRCSPSSTRPTR